MFNPLSIHVDDLNSFVLSQDSKSHELKLKAAPSKAIHYYDVVAGLALEKLDQVVKITTPGQTFYIDKRDLLNALHLESIADAKELSREVILSFLEPITRNRTSYSADKGAKDLLIARHYAEQGDIPEAFNWYESAIKQGSVPALFNLLNNDQFQLPQYKIAYEKLLGNACEEIPHISLSISQKYTSALQLAEIAPVVLIKTIKYFSLPKEERFSLAVRAAKTKPVDAFNLSDFIRNFSESQPERYELCLKFCEIDPHLFAIPTAFRFLGLTKEQRYSILQRVVEADFLAIFERTFGLRGFEIDPDAAAAIYFAIRVKGLADYRIGLSNLNKFIYREQAPIQGDLAQIEAQAKTILQAIEEHADPMKIVEEFHTFFKTHLNHDVNLGWLVEYLTTKDQFIRDSVFGWFFQFGFYAVCYPPFAKALEYPELFKEIVRCDAGDRCAMVQQLLELYLPYKKPSLELWHGLKDGFQGAAHTQLACVALASLPPTETESLLAFLEAIKNERTYYRDGKNQKLVLEVIDGLKSAPLTEVQRSLLMTHYFLVTQSERAAISRPLADLLSLKGTDIELPLSKESLNASIEKQLKGKLNLDIENYAEKYEKTIGKWRNRSALMTWIGRLDRLPLRDKKIALPLLESLIRSILEGTFSEDRMQMENPHLSSIFSFNPSMREVWQKGLSLEAEEIQDLLSIDQETPQERIFNFFKNHEDQIQKANYQHLMSYVKDGGECFVIIQQLNAVILGLERAAKEGLSMKQRKQALVKLKSNPVYSALLFEKSALQLLSGKQELTELMRGIKDLTTLLPANNAVRKGLEFILQSFGSVRTAYKVLDTDDPNQFVLMGTEVDNSCQKVDGIPRLNVCILGYSIDAKHRLALVTKSDGTIVARSVLRLFQDSENNPVLCQEQLYVSSGDPILPLLVRKIALKKATALGVPLVFKKGEYGSHEGISYPLNLCAGEKPVPFEYVDALKNILKGPYKISSLLRDPASIAIESKPSSVEELMVESGAVLQMLQASQEDIQRVLSTTDDPDLFKEAQDGLNLQITCLNEFCKDKEKITMVPLGFPPRESFNYHKLRFTTECPCCHKKKIKVERVFLKNAEFSLDSMYNDENDNAVSLEIAKKATTNNQLTSLRFERFFLYAEIVVNPLPPS